MKITKYAKCEMKWKTKYEKNGNFTNNVKIYTMEYAYLITNRVRLIYHLPY